MEIRIVVLGFIFALGACGGESENVATTSAENASSTASSKLGAYLAEDKVCDLLSTGQLQSLFNATVEVEKNGINFRNRFSCTYTWARPDAAERKQHLASSMVASMTGDGPKLTMRDMTVDSQVTISLRKSQRTADSFVPREQTEAEINQQIAAAKKRTDEQLTAAQKEVAGDAANSMVENILRKNNENEEVSGIGDAAYWSKLGSGSLEFLDSDVQATVSPVIGDSKEEDFENAKRIALVLLD